jgi:hypothetical protein
LTEEEEEEESYAMIRSQLLWFVVLANLLINLTRSGKYDWLLYLDERRNVECFFDNGRYFCHSNEQNIRLERNVNRRMCTVSGTPVSFKKLKDDLITTEMLIDWLIPFHLTEEYAHYLNSNDSTSIDDTLICNCTRTRIGVHCQYQIENKVGDLTNFIENQRGKPTGEYETLTSLSDERLCQVRFSPLEWRQICDGIIQCEDASDEFNCHLLELNQCEENEYRCRNGMCIPNQFAFDGTLDCLDCSDEQELPRLFQLFR